jgi:hypothetical protein
VAVEALKVVYKIYLDNGAALTKESQREPESGF